ncbi:MAG: DUF5694 domain-containing protein [Prevotellaceae bacterium]|nr:DUF5694 domain-containing protein [Prevotellaceae bacterium]
MYYRYIKQYGVNGSKKSLGDESPDLSFKLALQLGITRLYAIDDQQTVAEYNKAFNKCIKDGEMNGDTKRLQKLDRKGTRARVMPALFGRLGIHTNKPKSLERMHTINSVGYITHESSGCASCREHWNARNATIAKNLIQQLKQNPYQKSIVIIGAGHIIGLKEELQRQYPTIKVKLLVE